MQTMLSVNAHENLTPDRAGVSAQNAVSAGPANADFVPVRETEPMRALAVGDHDQNGSAAAGHVPAAQHDRDHDGPGDPDADRSTDREPPTDATTTTETADAGIAERGTDAGDTRRRTITRRPNIRSRLRAGLKVARLAHAERYIVHSSNALRLALEDAALRLYGGIKVQQAAAISTACRAEQNAQLMERWLRMEPELPLRDRIDIRDRIMRATEARDRAIARLGLDGIAAGPANGKPRDSFDSLYDAGGGVDDAGPQDDPLN